MQDSLANTLVTLVLPFGGVAGQRIVLDGINGIISIYNSSNQLVAQIDSTGQFEVFDPAGSGALTRMFSDTSSNGILFRLFDNPPHSSDVGSIIAVVGAGGLQAPPELHIQSPGWDSTPRARIELVGTDLTGNPPFIDFVAETGNVDARLNGTTLPRGKLGTYQKLTTSDVARAANINTDMVLTPTVDNTRLYRVHLKGQMVIGTAGVAYALGLNDGGTVGGNDGTIIDRLQRWNTAEAVSPVFINTAILYAPSTSGAKTLRVRNDGSGGTVTIQGGAGNERHFWIEDIGAQ